MGIATSLLLTLSGFAADSDVLRQKQQAQEKARALAGELIAAVLDTQLRQLDENGLAGLPIYRDIASMKQNLGGLMQHDMQAIVQLLVEAQAAPPDQRLARFQAACGRIREVVAQLMAERQKLSRRMQSARLAADVRQLIAVQTAVHDTTRSLPERRPDERERLALATIEDQADVQKLYYQLAAALADVSTWGGKAAAGAADGLRLIKAAQVEPELKAAAAALGQADFASAQASQRAVLKGLAALLEKLDESQGLADGDREAALRLVREVIRRQQNLRETTKATLFSERTTEPLIEQQTALQKELARLAPPLSRFPPTQPLLEEARAAAFEAIARLFEEQQPATITQQTRVIANLAQIEKVLEQGLDLARSDKSADELAAEVARLQALAKELTQAAADEAAIVEQVSAQPAAAAKRQTEVNQRLAGTNELGKFTSAIEITLETAKEKSAAALHHLGDEQAAAWEAQQAATNEALASIRQALAEALSQLADTQRRHKAVEVGELARASEAIERAAAAEREVSRQASEAAQTAGLTAEQAGSLAVEQSVVSEVAEKIAAGVVNTAPAASRQLAAAASRALELGRELVATADSPGEPSKPAARHAGDQAAAIAQQLLDAAAELRREQGRAALELTRIADEQLGQAATARQAVESAAETARSESAAAALSQLAEAAAQLDEAIYQQHLAEGRAEQAAANRLAEQIAAATRQQRQADAAADEIATGRANSPLVAASLQQDVADQVAQLAGRQPANMAAALDQARRAASDAAKETLSGSPAKAEAARRQVHRALDKAAQLARQAAQQATQTPTGPRDAAAQGQAADAAGRAQQFAAAAAPSSPAAREAAAALQAAQQQAAAASRQLASGTATSVAQAQQAASQALAQAEQQLAAATAALSARQAQQLAAGAGQAGELSRQAGQADPGAAAALAQAARAAQRGAQPMEAGGQFQHKLDQAAASLAAREQLLRRDRNLAETLAELARDQQASRETIRQAAQQLEQFAQQQAQRPESNRQQAAANQQKQLAAAQALQEAQQKFAAAQYATGQGAEEVSGQREVANQPIREGLELASRLDAFQLARLLAEGHAKEAGDRGQETGDKPAADQNASPLGTGLVPKSAEATAQQLAGPKADAAAKSAMAAAARGQGQGEAGQGQSETPKEGEASATATKGGAVKKGQASPNQKADKGELQTARAADADSRGELGEGTAASTGSGKVESEAWFAKLPPSLQSAIQAKSRGKAPRGYEERLRRYFESVD